MLSLLVVAALVPSIQRPCASDVECDAGWTCRHLLKRAAEFPERGECFDFKVCVRKSEEGEKCGGLVEECETNVCADGLDCTFNGHQPGQCYDPTPARCGGAKQCGDKLGLSCRYPEEKCNANGCCEPAGLVPTPPTNPCQTVRCSAGTQCIVDSNGQPQCEPVDLVPTPPTNPCQTVRCASGTRCIVDVAGQPQCVHWPFGCAPFGDKVCPKGTCCKEKFGIGYCGECETTVCCRMMPLCYGGFEEAKSTECNVLDYLTGHCKVVDKCCDSILCKRVLKY